MAETPEFAIVSLFAFFGILLAVAVRRLCLRIGIPYAPVILCAGLIWGLLLDWLGELGEAGEAWVELDPEMILLIFTPALIF
jgi:hypothetical protein